MQMMRNMVASGELDTLMGERVWNELQRALGEQTPRAFLQVLRECGALNIILSEVDALYGVPEPPKCHPEVDAVLHTELCLEQARKLTDDSAVLYATLLHDVGKAMTDPNNWPRLSAMRAWV